jgi:hypothetical protein
MGSSVAALNAGTRAATKVTPVSTLQHQSAYRIEAGYPVQHRSDESRGGGQNHRTRYHPPRKHFQ